MPPDEIEARVASGKLSMQQLLMSAKVQILSAPLTGQFLHALVYPDAKKQSRKLAHSRTNMETFEALKAMRDTRE